jgi:hypothetical protein
MSIKRIQEFMVCIVGDPMSLSEETAPTLQYQVAKRTDA